MSNKIQLFYLYGSEAFSGTEDRGANFIAKDIPLAFMAQEIPRIWLATCEPLTVDEDFIYIYIYLTKSSAISAKPKIFTSWSFTKKKKAFIKPD